MPREFTLISAPTNQFFGIFSGRSYQEREVTTWLFSVVVNANDYSEGPKEFRTFHMDYEMAVHQHLTNTFITFFHLI